MKIRNMGQSFKPLVLGLLAGPALGFCVFALIHLGLNRSAARPVIEDFNLPQVDGSPTRLYDQRSAKAIVLYTHGIGCPIVRQGLAKLEVLMRKPENEGVVVFLINANPQDSVEDIRQEAAEMKSTLPILKDENQNLIRKLGIQRTGHVMVIQPNSWTLEYSGALDGERLGLDRSTDQKFLEDVLNDLRAGVNPRIRESVVTGCVIGT